MTTPDASHPRPRSGLDLLLGSGPKVGCRVVSADISVHWWPADAKPGDPCLCGDRHRQIEP